MIFKLGGDAKSIIKDLKKQFNIITVAPNGIRLLDLKQRPALLKALREHTYVTYQHIPSYSLHQEAA